jgi:hypothetical protein
MCCVISPGGLQTPGVRQPSSWMGLFQVCADHIDQLGRPLGPLRIWLVGRINHVVADVVLHQLDREAVHGATDGGDQHQHVRAAELGFQGPLDRLDLPLDPADPGQELRLFLDRVGHGLS